MTTEETDRFIDSAHELAETMRLSRPLPIPRRPLTGEDIMSNEIKVDDEFEIRVRVVKEAIKKTIRVEVLGVDLLPVGCTRTSVVLWEEELLAARRLPRPIKVGDRVTWGASLVSLEVLCIHGDQAFLGNPEFIEDKKSVANPWVNVKPLSELIFVS